MQEISIKELEKEIERLKSLNKLKDDTISTLGHELRNALNTVVGLSDLIKSGDLNSVEIKQAADIIHRNGSNLKQLVNNLLDMDKIEEGNLQLHYSSFEINDFLKDLKSDYEFLSDQKNISIELDLLSEPLEIYADKIKIWQIMGNLVSNAIKFTESGGTVNVSVNRNEDEFEEADSINLKIQDNGIGIPEEFLPKLFNKFGMHHRPGTNTERGIGIGLSVVKNLVDLHNGTIEVDSTENKGSTFTIDLPIDAKNKLAS